MKKFKSPICHSDYKFSVENGVAGVRVAIAGEGDYLNMFLAPSDAPALALAILEAAGGRDSLGIDVGNAMTDLREYVAERNTAAAEAKELAELEAEALKFYLAFHSAVDRPCQDWDYLDQKDKRQWLAVAREIQASR